jgi:hypothetical protein
MKAEVIKKLISDDGKSFSIGTDIAFKHKNNDYIVEIADIGMNSFVGKNIIFNQRKISGVMLFPLEEVSNCRHVSCD